MRKATGLCFNCDKKFTLSHRCPNRRLLLLQWNEEPPYTTDQEATEFVVELELGTQVEETRPKLSLNAMNGDVASRTMRFTRSVKRQPIKVLLDGEVMAISFNSILLNSYS